MYGGSIGKKGSTGKHYLMSKCRRPSKDGGGKQRKKRRSWFECDGEKVDAPKK